MSKETFTLPLKEGAKSALIFSYFKKGKKALHAKDLILNGAKLKTLSKDYKLFFAAIATESENSKHTLTLVNFSDEIKKELSEIKRTDIPEKELASEMGYIERLGEKAFEIFDVLKTLLYLLSESVYWSSLGLFDKKRVPFKGTAKQLITLGSEAAPIVFILVFLIAFTLALQSANMLNTFGAGEYLAFGMGFLMFAEMGPLLTAIILAGRSGSSITAEIASMAVNEEIKALRTMGISPIQYLVLPRFKAMSIGVPVLSFCASIIGCVAGMIVAGLFCEISSTTYWNALRDGLPILLLFKSIFKSLVFGWIVTLIACLEGFKVHGGADAVGTATTKCVVYSIAGIILADAAFSFIFY